MPGSKPPGHLQATHPEIEHIAAVAKALAHPARLKIVSFLLSHEGCIAGDIVDEVGLAQSTVSEHLRVLKAAGVIVGAIEHPRICYSLDPAALEPLRALLDRVAARPVAAGTSCIVPGRDFAPAVPRHSTARE